MKYASPITLFFAAASVLIAQYNTIDFEGAGLPPRTQVPATSVSIGNPMGVTTDAAGNVYIAGPSIVLKLDPAGMLTRIAGNGHNGYSGDGGPATDALLGFPRAFPADPLDWGDLIANLVVDSGGNLYITDVFNNRVRKINLHGVISTVAGSGLTSRSVAEDQLATNAKLWMPGGVAAGSTGRLYIADGVTLYQITPDGLIQPLTGNNCGHPDQPGVCAAAQIAVDANDNIYVADGWCRIRKLDASGNMSTVAGNDRSASYWIPDTCGDSGDGALATSSSLDSPYGVAVDAAGDVFIADTYSNRIRKVTPDGIITTVAGRGPSYTSIYHGGYSGDGGPATNAQLNLPHSVAVDTAGNIYIADSENFRIRKVSTDGIITTVAGNGAFCCLNSTISASPNPCVLSGGVCTSYITWNTASLSNAQVWVKVDSGPESALAFATSCTDCVAPWIEGGGSVYTFTLYDCSSVSCTDTDHRNAPVVGAVQVTAQ